MEEYNLKIAVLSGKGGTGKTFVSVNLAAVISDAIYLDCDVEEPNGHLFFKPDLTSIEEVYVKVPVVDTTKCSGCRQCVEFCKFNALAYINNSLLIFSELCHSCGGCSLICPDNALSEIDKSVGNVQMGTYKDLTVITGIMNPGEESGVPIIQHLLDHACDKENIVVIDCPAGSSCTVMESIKDADYCVLVTEPTLLSVHNLSMIHELARLLNKPCGVVINKYLNKLNPVEQFCQENNLSILARIGFDLYLSEIGAKGLIAVEENRDYQAVFSQLYKQIIKEAGHEAVIDNQR